MLNAWLGLAIAGSLVWIGLKLSAMERRIRDLARINAKLDVLLQQAGLQSEDWRYTDIAPEELDALRRGDKIAALKHYRQRTGAGLRESKDVLEDVQRHLPQQ